MRGIRHNLLNQKFGKLTVLENIPSKKNDKGKSFSYWKCQCDCGKIVEIKTFNLIVNKTRSCGCLKIEWAITQGKKNFHGDGVSSINYIYRQYQARAKNRLLNFDLTKDEFKSLILQNCYYCGIEPNCIYHKYKKFEAFRYNSLDRINPYSGYSLNNVVPACQNCNSAKMQLTQTDFFNMIKKIYERHKLSE